MDNVMEKIMSLAKRRGFIYQGSEIYGGMAGTWDYGPIGTELKNNVKNLWWRHFVSEREDMYGIDSAIIMHPKVWEASGHVSGFGDLLVDCKECKNRFRADHLIEEQTGADVEGLALEEVDKIVREQNIQCPNCKKKNWGSAKNFNLLFKTYVGPVEDQKAIAYLRGETAQGMFVNFKNIIDSYHPKLPFGMAQIGRCFRNEIAPRDFVFRVREFEIAELEYFIRPDADWNKIFEEWLGNIKTFAERLGIDHKKFNLNDKPAEKRAHYSKRTIDIEYPFPFGVKELWAIAYRTDYDLTNHIQASGIDLTYLDEASKEKFIPHVIEPTFGVDRTVFAVLCESYSEDELGGEKRVYLKLSPKISPVKAAVFPLLKNKPELVEKARGVYQNLKKEIPAVMWDDNGNIGKRYRRQDEIGTPYCITVDFDSLNDDTVTVRDRDSGKQERIKISALNALLISKIK